MVKKAAEASSGKTRDLLIHTIDGEYKVAIPAEAKMTFGPAFPSTRKDKYGNQSFTGGREYAVRIYVGTKENLIAVFTGVRQVRDMSINVSKKVTAEAGKVLWRSDESGYEVTQSAEKKAKFVDEKLLNGGS